ncbi:MAG: hypothetical protein RR773_04710, partial [Raoultibacter sp.]
HARPVAYAPFSTDATSSLERIYSAKNADVTSPLKCGHNQSNAITVAFGAPTPAVKARVKFLIWAIRFANETHHLPMAL